MSPTSCRCSTPRRHHLTCLAHLARTGLLPVRGAPAAASPPMGSPPEYSPALRRVTTGFGMGPGGSTALSATGAPRTASSARSSRTTHVSGVCRWGDHASPELFARARSRGGTRPRRALARGLPSAMSTARLRSVARRPPAASQPGRLPGALPILIVGRLVLGRDSRLDAFSGSPVRT